MERSVEGEVFPAKKTATQVKHMILNEYLSAWGGIIINTNSTVRLCFVDTCCGSGVYAAAEDGAPNEVVASEDGSAVIGMKQMVKLRDFGVTKGKSVTCRALFINSDSRELETLRGAITRAVDNPFEHELLCGEFAGHCEDVLKFTRDHFTFVFIDPYGPTPAPFACVSKCVSAKYTDSIINFPFLTLQKWSGWLSMPEMSADQIRKLSAADAFMGGDYWRSIAASARESDEDLGEALLGAYTERLKNLGVGVVSIPLMFEDRERTIYYLIFTTRNLAGLSKAKAVFQKAIYHEKYLREKKRDLKLFKATGQGLLGFAQPETNASPVVSIDQLAKEVVGTFAKKSVPFSSVLAFTLQLPLVLEGHTRTVLSQLRKSGSCQFAGALKYNDPVKFS